jgi:hypothetical protein
MLAILRVLFGFALFVVFGKAIEVAGPSAQTEGTTDAGYLAVAVIVGIANAVVWAPWVGHWMSDPLTGAFTTGHPADFTNSTLQFAHKLALRRWRRLALFFAFLEGVRHPDLPGAFVLGLNQARPGSWLEKVFAREVWRFENAENCLRAWKILRQRGQEPKLHAKAEVQLLILSQQRETPPTPHILAVPAAPPAPRPVRNPGIRIFEGTPSAPSATAAGSAIPVDALDRPTNAEIAAPAHCVHEARAATPDDGASSVTPGQPATETSALSVVGNREESASAPTLTARRKLRWSQRLKVLWSGTLED